VQIRKNTHYFQNFSLFERLCVGLKAETELRVLRCDANIAGQSLLEAAAVGVAIDRCDYRLVQLEHYREG
jgi:hypothetical protein